MNAINWFEIPTRDIGKAKRFYEQILAQRLQDDASVAGFKMAVFPSSQEGVGGAIAEFEQGVPNPDGVRIYLNGGADLGAILARVPAAGGAVVMDKTFVRKDIGHIGLFRDLDGNVVGLHSMG